MYNKIHIGYWRSADDNIVDENSHYPSVHDYIKPELWSEKYGGNEIKQLVIDYLESFKLINHQMGYSGCRICGVLNGTAERSDGEFVYPEGYTHYIKEHDVIPPKKIVFNALRWAKKKPYDYIKSDKLESLKKLHAEKLEQRILERFTKNE